MRSLCVCIAVLAAGLPAAGVNAWRPAVWIEPSLEAWAATDTAALRDALSSAGLEPVVFDAADLADPARLDPAEIAFLVICYGPCYPAAGFEALDRYLRGGGACIAFGGERFGDPVFAVEGRWVPLDAGVGQPVWPRERPAWNLAMHGEGGPLEVSGEGTAASPLLCATRGLESYQYAGVRPGPLPERGAVIAFEARGDAQTPFLCLELQENDGSRWKRIIELSTDWRAYRLHTASFVRYAAEKSEPGHFHPAETKALWFGLFGKLVGSGPHRFEMRNMCVHEAAVPSEAAAGVPIGGRELVRRFLGREVPPAPPKQWPDPFPNGRRFSAAAVRGAGGGAFGANLAGVPGSFEGVTLAPPQPDAGDPARPAALLFPGARAAARFVPLLEAVSPDGPVIGPVAGLIVNRAGRHAGSEWAVFGLNRAGLGSGPLRDLFLQVARHLAEGVAAGPISITAASGSAGAELVFSQPVRNRAQHALSGRLKHAIETEGGAPVAMEATTDLAPSSVTALEWFRTPLEGFNWRMFRARTDIGTERGPSDRVTFGLDARQTLRDLADFLVACGADDGKFSGTHYFVDHRGARTLLAAHAIFGDRRYLDAALAWAQVMAAEQREDGGYRMGYGITSRGEACFVADGGEIALGVVRAAMHADGADRDRLLDSVRAYMGYRDGFRCAGGGIGVGWCLDDFGKRPIGRLDAPTKIFAPEMNTYTIGCTLGAAYAWASLTGRQEDLASARQDADWFMARTARGLTGASAESFVLAHALESEPVRRRCYEEFLRKQFVEPMAASTTEWWLASGGRAALNLHALAYCRQRLGGDPRIAAQMARAALAMFSPESPESMHHLIGRPKLNHDEWIYLCFGGISLADTIEPLASFRKLSMPAQGQPAHATKGDAHASRK